MAAVLFIAALTLPGVHYLRLSKTREQQQKTSVENWFLCSSSQMKIGIVWRSWNDCRGRQKYWRIEWRHAALGQRYCRIYREVCREWGDLWLERLEVLPVAEISQIASPQNDPGDGAVEESARPTIRLRLTGRLLDRENPLSRGSPAAYERVTALLGRFVESPRIMEVEGERFDASEPGLLRFDFTLVINPTASLGILTWPKFPVLRLSRLLPSWPCRALRDGGAGNRWVSRPKPSVACG